MRKKDPENEKLQRETILRAAWKLFYEKGYEKTSIQEILDEIGASKGRFYYYFSSKAELLLSLYEIFDNKYLDIYRGFDEGISANEKMIRLQYGIFCFLEQEVGHELLKDLYLTQLEGRTSIDFWSSSRVYSDILKEIIDQAMAEGSIRSDIPAEEVIDSVIVTERGQFIDWCLRNGSYSLCGRGLRKVAVHLGGFNKRYENYEEPLLGKIEGIIG